MQGKFLTTFQSVFLTIPSGDKLSFQLKIKQTKTPRKIKRIDLQKSNIFQVFLLDSIKISTS